MELLNSALDWCRNVVRAVIDKIALIINRATGGHLSPNTVTVVALLAHIPIAWLIATRHNLWAAALLVIFGLFDALDGSLARLQRRSSNGGMLLDASTDRFKEVMLYTGAAYSFVTLGRPYMATWAVAACGASLCVSYVKAKGETAVAGGKLTATEVNRLFQNGLMRFEVRMGILLIGLVTDRVILATIIIAVFSSLTAVGRLVKISRKLATDV